MALTLSRGIRTISWDGDSCLALLSSTVIGIPDLILKGNEILNINIHLQITYFSLASKEEGGREKRGKRKEKLVKRPIFLSKQKTEVSNAFKICPLQLIFIVSTVAEFSGGNGESTGADLVFAKYKCKTTVPTFILQC